MRNSSTARILRISAGILVLTMLVVVLFSAFCIAAEAGHECSGEDCPICATIHQCEKTLRGFGDGTASRTAFPVPMIPILLAAAFAVPAVCQDTLISGKVRLNF